MAYITGPMIDTAVEELRRWYLETSMSLMEALEEGYPYGSDAQTPEEQLNRFFALTPADWDNLAAKLQLRYRGQSNIEELVRADIQEYVTRMSRLAYGGKA